MADTASNKLNILFLGKFNSTENLSGPEKYSKRIFEYFENTENASFIEYFDDGKKYSFFKKLFGSERVFENRNIFRMGILPFLFHIGTSSYDVIHLLSFERFAQLAYIFFSRRPFVYSIHGIIEKEDAGKANASSFYKLKNGIAENQFLEKSKRGIIFSDQLHSELPLFFDKIPSQIAVLHHGIDHQFLKEFMKDIQTEQPLRVLFLGGFRQREISAEKVITFLSKQGIPLEITCVGFGKTFTATSSSVRLNFISKANREGWKLLLFNNDIFISPYKHETFSIASLEAMAMGNIIICDTTSGISRFITPGENGFKIDIESYIDILNIIIRICDNKAFRKAITNSAIESVKNLSWDSVGIEHKKEYLEMISERKELL